MLSSPVFQAFNLFGIEIRYYSIFMALGMLFGCALVYFISKKIYKDGLDETLFDFLPVVIISGVLGARIYYVLFNLDYFISDPLETVMINHGGISIHGAILGGFLGGYIFSRIKKINFLHLCDLTSFGLILGQAIGRAGNYFNSEALGLPCDYLWKMYVAPQFRPLEYRNYEYFHPAFLYEIIWNIFVLCLLFLINKKYKDKNLDGLIFFSYIILYSIGRFFIEGIRIDNIFTIMGLHLAQVISLIFILTGVFGIIYIKKKKESR